MSAAQRDPAGTKFTKTTHHDTYPAIDPTLHSNLSGRSVLITGASKGVGRATAISYAKAGASQIALAARSDFGSLEREIAAAAQAAGKPAPQVLSLRLDVQDYASVQQAAALTKGAFGGLDILINNAGRLESFVPIVDGDIDEHWNTWEVNYRGLYWVTKAFLPLMLAKKRDGQDGLKTIVNLTSIGAHLTIPGGSAYQTSKLAVLRLTEILCAEYGGQGLLSFAVHPGGVMTELSSKMPKALHHALCDTPEMSADTLVFLTQKKIDWLAGRYVDCTWDVPELLSREKEIVDGGKLLMRMVQ